MNGALMQRVILGDLSPSARQRIVRRTAVVDPNVRAGAAVICEGIRTGGDAALTTASERFGGGRPASLTVTRSEMDALRAAGAVGDLLGRFFDQDGKVVDCEFNDRVLGLELEALRGRQVTAIAGGREKLASIRGALAMGLISTLVTDEATAESLVEDMAT